MGMTISTNAGTTWESHNREYVSLLNSLVEFSLYLLGGLFEFVTMTFYNTHSVLYPPAVSLSACVATTGSCRSSSVPRSSAAVVRHTQHTTRAQQNTQPFCAREVQRCAAPGLLRVGGEIMGEKTKKT